jgi:hypothetical protein
MNLFLIPDGVMDGLRENFSLEEVAAMSPRMVMDEWLKWEGIIGYTDPILRLAKICIFAQLLDEANEN